MDSQPSRLIASLFRKNSSRNAYLLQYNIIQCSTTRAYRTPVVPCNTGQMKRTLGDRVPTHRKPLRQKTKRLHRRARPRLGLEKAFRLREMKKKEKWTLKRQMWKKVKEKENGWPRFGTIKPVRDCACISQVLQNTAALQRMSYWYGQASAIRRSYQAAAAAQCLPTDVYKQPKRLRNSQVMQFPCCHSFELSSQLFSYQSDMASQQKRSVGGYSSFASFCTCWGPADSRLNICELSILSRTEIFQPVTCSFRSLVVFFPNTEVTRFNRTGFSTGSRSGLNQMEPYRVRTDHGSMR